MASAPIAPPEHEYTWQAPYTREAAIVLCHRGRPERLLAACRALTALPPSPWRFRLIVVDQGSDEASLAMLRLELPLVLAQCPATPVAPLLLSTPRDLGPAAAVNRGLREVREPYVLLWTPGSRWVMGAPGLLFDALASQPEAVLAAPRWQAAKGDELPSARPLPGWLSELLSPHLAQRWLTRHWRTGDATRAVPALAGGCLAIHLARLKPIGGLDERLDWAFALSDLGARLRQVGALALWVPSDCVEQAQDADDDAGTGETQPAWRASIQHYQARYRYFAKHRGRWAVGVLGLGLFLRLTLSVLLGVLVVPARGFTQAARTHWHTQARLWLWHAALTRPRWGSAVS